MESTTNMNTVGDGALKDQKPAASGNNVELEADVMIDQADSVEGMESTSLGRAWNLVECVLRNHKKLARQWGSNDVLPLAVDDLVYMADRLIQTQTRFRSEDKPTNVDLGYHYTSIACVQRIQLDGLLSRPERQEKGIDVGSHGSAFGEGVYVASDPFSSANFGEVGLLVVRLPGVVSPYHRRRQSSPVRTTGTDSRDVGSFLVLNGADQVCIVFLFNIFLQSYSVCPSCNSSGSLYSL